MVVDVLVLPRTWWWMQWFYPVHVVDVLVLPRTWWLMYWFYPGQCGCCTGSTQDMVVDVLVLPRT